MHINSLAVLTAIISGAAAIDSITRGSRYCATYAVTTSNWTENNLRRRRVVYDTTKYLVSYDPIMYSLGWMWSNEKDACNARAGDVNVYYNGLVIPGGAYVIDTSEKLGPVGDEAHECLLNVFRVTLANNLNCTGKV
ncbi:hypothetical protein BDW02DRAFT_573453 [Decorospora gaudefroyi]|uniref:Uncharacterized protein n=1 Tax=Decorospora gaudefroyi TaxID=184978 RepID=A0A6A5K6C8_9PLEO|nr:hypothetical protein BDW02DRAFT_573453 [Decorospora gaudefroyi]